MLDSIHYTRKTEGVSLVCNVLYGQLFTRHQPIINTEEIPRIACKPLSYCLHLKLTPTVIRLQCQLDSFVDWTGHWKVVINYAMIFSKCRKNPWECLRVGRKYYPRNTITSVYSVIVGLLVHPCLKDIKWCQLFWYGLFQLWKENWVKWSLAHITYVRFSRLSLCIGRRWKHKLRVVARYTFFELRREFHAKSAAAPNKRKFVISVYEVRQSVKHIMSRLWWCENQGRHMF